MSPARVSLMCLPGALAGANKDLAMEKEKCPRGLFASYVQVTLPKTDVLRVVWIFLKWGHFWWKRSWKLKNQRKKPKHKHLCSHHGFFLLLVVCSN